MAGKRQYGPNDWRLSEILNRQPETVVVPPSAPQSIDDIPVAPAMENEGMAPWVIAENRIRSISKQINPRYGTPAEQVYTFDRDQYKKYIDEPYGFAPGIDNDDFYSDQEGFWGYSAKLPLRLGTRILTKMGQNLGFVGSLGIEGAKYMGDLIGINNYEGSVVGNAADNAFSAYFRDGEEYLKNESFLKTFNALEDRDKGFWSRFWNDKEFWSEDVVDGAAFLGAAWIPGMTLSRLGLGKYLTKGGYKLFGKPIANPSVLGSVDDVAAGTDYFTNAQKIASTLDKFNAWGIATASESLFEGKEIKDRVYESLGVDEFGMARINPETGKPYTEEEKKLIASGAARNGFLMNAALLSLTNLAELPYVSRAFKAGNMSKTFGGNAGLSKGVTGTATFGETAAARVPKNKWERFLDSNYGTFSKGLGAGVVREGFIEENAQLAIQRFNEFYGANGKIASMLDFSTLTGLGSGMAKQTADAITGDDQEAAMNIGLGGLIGGTMTALQTRSKGKEDKLSRDKAIEYYNLAQESWLKFGNIYQTESVTRTDENGNEVAEERIVLDDKGMPVEDQEKIAGILSGAKSYVDKLTDSEAAEDTNPFMRKFLRDNAFKDLVQAHMALGNEALLMKKIDALYGQDPASLAKLGFAKDDNFETELNRYKRLAALVVNQNKALNADIMFDRTKDDEARRKMLTDIASQQAVLKNLLVDETTDLENIKAELLNTDNTSLSDGLVDQLNGLNYRIMVQEKQVEELTAAGNKKTLLNLSKEYLDELKQKKETLLKNNEATAAELKQDSEGFYKYEKDARNEPGLLNAINKRIALKGNLENGIGFIGKQWGFIADFKTGKSNFLSLFDDTVVTPINDQIEQTNTQLDEEDFDDIVNLDDDFDVETQDIELGAPTLDSYLRQRFEDLQNRPEGFSIATYEAFRNDIAANSYINFYNQKYGKNEPTNKMPEITGDTEDVDIDNDLLENEAEDTAPVDELGNQSMSSLKLGPYTISIGDRINDEEVRFITNEIVQVGENILQHSEVRKMLDAFRGRNITRKGQQQDTSGTTLENGEIPDVQDTKTDVVTQDIVNEKGEPIIFGGSDRVIRAGSKVNSTSELTIRDKVGPNRIDRRRVSPNPNYPMVLGTPDINIGSKLKLVADTTIGNFSEYNSVNPVERTAKKASDFFDGKTIKKNQVDNFPVKITADVNGKEVFIGYLPTVKWVETRWDNGTAANVVEFLEDGTNNMAEQVKILRKLRQDIFNKHNANPDLEITAVVDTKSEGKLRLDPDQLMNKLSDVVHPDTKLGIIRNGMIHVGVDEVLDPSNLLGPKDLKEGRPVMIINTPRGNEMVSFVGVPKLTPAHQEFVINAWSAFHRVMNAKDLSKIPDQIAIVKAVYNAYDAPFEEGIKPDFNVLRNYVNDYITYTSSKKQYNPLMKVGTSQLNITEDGNLIAYVVKDKKSDTDLVIANGPAEFQEKQDAFRDKMSELYYNVKTSTEFSNGINSSAKMRFLSVVGGKLKESEPMTYNEYMMTILETNLERGRPVDPKNPESPFVYFANPVVTFNVVGDNNAALEKAKPVPVVSAEEVEKKAKEKADAIYSLKMVISGYEDDLIPRYKEEIKELIRKRESIDVPSVLSNKPMIGMLNEKIKEYENEIERLSKSLEESKNKLAALEGGKPAAQPVVTPTAPIEDRPIEYGEVFSTGTTLGLNDLFGNVPKSFPDFNRSPGGKEFKQFVIGNKKIFTIVDSSISDVAGRAGYITTSIMVDKNSPTTLDDVKADLEAIHARTLSGVESNRKINKAKVVAALTGVRWTSRKPDAQSAPGTSIADLAKQAAPEDGSGLLDLDIDFGETAEDIGNLNIDPESDLNSIRTSLKELKKSCE